MKLHEVTQKKKKKKIIVLPSSRNQVIEVYYYIPERDNTQLLKNPSAAVSISISISTLRLKKRIFFLLRRRMKACFCNAHVALCSFIEALLMLSLADVELSEEKKTLPTVDQYVPTHVHSYPYTCTLPAVLCALTHMCRRSLGRFWPEHPMSG